MPTNNIIFLTFSHKTLSHSHCIIVSFLFQSDRSTAQENKVTVTLIAVVVLFLVCQTPSAIQLIYLMSANEYSNVDRGNYRYLNPKTRN